MPPLQRETRRETRLPTQRRALAPTPQSYDADAHTVDLVASAGADVRRYGWDGAFIERLDVNGALLGRVEAGQCPLLDSHNAYSIDDQIGVVTAARVEDASLITTVRFTASDRGQEIEARVAAGDLRGVSVGYRVAEMVLTGQSDDTPIYTVTSWELYEVSLTPIPADMDAGVRSITGDHPCTILNPQETRAMPPVELPAADPAATSSPAPTEVRAAPSAPAATPTADPVTVRLHGDELFQFVEDAHTHGVRAEQIRTWATTMTPDAARSALLRHLGDEQRARSPLRPAHSAARVTLDERDTARDAIASALLHRHNPRNELHEAGREYRGMSLLEMARRNLERNGEKTSGLGRREVADLALRTHSTSDFPNILSNVAGRTLRSGYEASVQTFKAWMRRASVPDFRQVSRLQLGGAPNFLLVPEGGEFKMGTLGEGKEVYAIATYGRRFAVTRQVIVNDDLDAFTRIPEMWGRAAADFESDAAYAPLITNPNMGDGNPLFSTGAGNQAGAGGAISETSVQAAEVGLGSQVGIEGRPINVQPKWLITAVKDRVPGQKLLRSTDAAGAQGTVNVYQNAMTQVVEARLNRASGATPWFVAADYAQVDTIEYAYLEGDDGVFLDERVGFEVDGIEYKARLDFGVKAIDRRGLYMNPGL